MEDSKNINEVITVCPNHTNPEEIMPLVYNSKSGDSICVTCGERYRLLEGVQVMWTRELQARAIKAAKTLANGGEVEVHRLADESSKIKASVVLCRLYMEKVSSKWTIEQMKEYFDVDTITIY